MSDTPTLTAVTHDPTYRDRLRPHLFNNREEHERADRVFVTLAGHVDTDGDAGTVAVTLSDLARFTRSYRDDVRAALLVLLDVELIAADPGDVEYGDPNEPLAITVTLAHWGIR